MRGIDEPHATNLSPSVLRSVVLCLLTAVGSARGVTYSQIDALAASDPAPYDLLGVSVAASGNTAVVGAFGDDDHGNASGSAYVFDIPTGNELFKLTASDAAADDLFGISVAVSGSTAVIGAYQDDDHGNASGSAYVFDIATGSELLKLTASDASANDLFGYSVAISGNAAVIGAYQNDDHGSASGSAYVFDVTTGNELFKLTASDASAGDRFGASVALSGNAAVIGAYQDDDMGGASGSAYVFDISTGSELFKLTASDGRAGDQFGYSVALSGGRAIVGANEDDHSGTNSGSAYLFDVSTGDELFKLTASDGTSGDRLGASVAGSGNRAVVGADRDDDRGTNSGAAYVFDMTTGAEISKLIASDGAAHDNFGIALAISGSTTVIGAYGDNHDSVNVGSAYVFASAIPGDINGDGTVDVADLGLLAAQWGTAGLPPDNADIAPFPGGDGTVNVADLGLLAANWSDGSGQSLSGATAVPLPSAGLAALTFVGALAFRRRAAMATSLP